MEYVSTVWAWINHQIQVIFHSGLPIFFWVRPKWSVDQMPDQTGKVILVTGGNSGTGYATSLAYYNAGATVYLACRNEKKALKAIEEIKKGGEIGLFGYTYPPSSSKSSKKGRVEYVNLDLADLASVDKCAEEFLKKENQLDVLFANAGIMATEEGQYTKQGYTLQFGSMVLGHHRLITLLLPTLLSSPPSEPSRVILSSSAGHETAPPSGVDYTSVVRDPSLSKDTTRLGRRGDRELGRWSEYGQAKWGNIALAKWLDYEYGVQGRLISAAVHPGLVATNLADHLSLAASLLKSLPWIVPIFTFQPSVGALNQIYAGSLPLPEAWYLNGQYIVPFQTIGQARPDLNDRKKVEKLWEWCDEQGKKWA
ncbi:hypothetical protein CI109_106678 [Kwoniella shandongensis]|uniref:Uncharacterized protein n=1 Tax=Kwoniella shandongensis TaxID=1734106 RepID=A0A5M6BQS6_9TREE|nr:uncharacterized protein CI109_006416 [Kwoniella shandongensis]KAA5525246.1 hypothetical protein CI109_006416 [Kwoniella shandongensis]